MDRETHRLVHKSRSMALCCLPIVPFGGPGQSEWGEHQSEWGEHQSHGQDDISMHPNHIPGNSITNTRLHESGHVGSIWSSLRGGESCRAVM